MKKKFTNFSFVLTSIILLLSSCTAQTEPENALATQLIGALATDIANTKILQNSSFTTDYNAKIKNRTHNLVLATKSIHDVVIQPTDTFSFNETLGPITKDRGYKSAKIFIKGKELEGIGGGVCQVSSTLYNAADKAGLEIVERHPHSKRVHYVEKNRDAATSYGGIDLKIKNNMQYPVKIIAKADNGKLTVSLERI